MATDRNRCQAVKNQIAIKALAAQHIIHDAATRENFHKTINKTKQYKKTIKKCVAALLAGKANKC